MKTNTKKLEFEVNNNEREYYQFTNSPQIRKLITKKIHDAVGKKLLKNGTLKWKINGKCYISEVVEYVNPSDPYYEAYLVGRRDGNKAKKTRKRIVTKLD